MKKLTICVLAAVFAVLGSGPLAAQEEAIVFTPQWTAQAQFAGY